MIRPVASTSVVTSGAETTAGSMRNRLASNGIVAPTVAAQAQMMDIANREKQFLLANRAYADKTALEASGYRLPSEVSRNYEYAISVGTGTVPSFTITFTAIGSQASDGNLTLNSEGVKTPADKW